MLSLQFTLLPGPAQLKAFYPLRPWELWLSTLPEHITQHNKFIAAFLANFEMVKLAQALVLPVIRLFKGFHRRAMAIQSVSTQLGSGFVAGGMHTSSDMHGPLLVAHFYLPSLSDH
jgi:hypothetical protein